MSTKNEIILSKKTDQICEELIETVYEWEESITKMDVFRMSGASTLNHVCAELRKILEGEKRIRTTP